MVAGVYIWYISQFEHDIYMVKITLSLMLYHSCHQVFLQISCHYTQFGVLVLMSISTGTSVFNTVKEGYTPDPSCKWLFKTNTTRAKCMNGLWYIGKRLLIPRAGELWENLFWLAHDVLGYFGADKGYALLQDAYYWLNTQWGLRKSYVPSCE